MECCVPFIELPYKCSYYMCNFILIDIEHIVSNLNQCFMIFIVFIYTKSVSARFLRVRAPRRTSKSSN
jgi:hypothetical protein